MERISYSAGYILSLGHYGGAITRHAQAMAVLVGLDDHKVRGMRRVQQALCDRRTAHPPGRPVAASPVPSTAGSSPAGRPSWR